MIVDISDWWKIFFSLNYVSGGIWIISPEMDSLKNVLIFGTHLSDSGTYGSGDLNLRLPIGGLPYLIPWNEAYLMFVSVSFIQLPK